MKKNFEFNLDVAKTIILVFLVGFALGLLATTPNEAILDRYEKMLDTTLENNIGE